MESAHSPSVGCLGIWNTEGKHFFSLINSPIFLKKLVNNLKDPNTFTRLDGNMENMVSLMAVMHTWVHSFPILCRINLQEKMASNGRMLGLKKICQP